MQRLKHRASRIFKGKTEDKDVTDHRTEQVADCPATIRTYDTRLAPWEAQGPLPPDTHDASRMLNKKSSLFSLRKPEAKDREGPTSIDESAPPVPAIPAKYKLFPTINQPGSRQVPVLPKDSTTRPDAGPSLFTSSSTPPRVPIPKMSRKHIPLMAQYNSESTPPVPPLNMDFSSSKRPKPSKATPNERGLFAPSAVKREGNIIQYPLGSSVSVDRPLAYSHQDRSMKSAPQDTSPPLEPNTLTSNTLASNTLIQNTQISNPLTSNNLTPNTLSSNITTSGHKDNLLLSSTPQETSRPSPKSACALLDPPSTQPSSFSASIPTKKEYSREEKAIPNESKTSKSHGPVQWPQAHPLSPTRPKQSMTEPARTTYAIPSGASDAAERWLNRGTGPESVLLSLSSSNRSPVTVTPYRYQGPPVPHQAPLATTQPGLATTRNSSSSSRRQESPEQDRVTSSSGISPSHLSGGSSLGKGSRGLLRAKKSLKNLFRKGSSEADLQYVSRPVLVPQPGPDNDVPPMPTRVAFNRPSGPPPPRPERGETDGELLGMSNLTMTRVGFVRPVGGGAGAGDDQGAVEGRRRVEQYWHNRDGRYSVAQNGEVLLPRERGAAAPATRRGMMIRDGVAGTMEFVPDI